MNHRHESSGGAGVAIAIGLLLVLLLLAVVGVGAGFMLFSARSSVVALTPPVSMKAASTGSSIAAAPLPVSSVVCQLPLSELDIKETLESPALAATKTSVLLAYASQTSADERTIFLARSTNGGASFDGPNAFRKTKIFTAVSQSKEGKEIKRPIRALPQLAASEDKMFLGWIEPNAENTTVFYYVAESADGGLNWSEPLRVHESDGARPNFIGLACDAQGNLVASWLDQRAGIPQPFAAVKKADAAKFQPESQVYSSTGDTGVCPCCPTAAAIAPDGQVYVAFRNQVDGYRDIYVASRSLEPGSEFGQAESVVKEPRWKFDGCPHDGPSIVADQKTLIVAWMDASSGQTRVSHASRSVSSAAFNVESYLEYRSHGMSESQPKLSRIVNGSAYAVWTDDVGEGNSAKLEGDSSHSHGPGGSSREIHIARGVSDDIGANDGKKAFAFGESKAVLPRAAAFQSRPVVIALDGSPPIIAFHELDEQGKRIVAVRVNEDLPSFFVPPTTP
jgi:hypothetical protein